MAKRYHSVGTGLADQSPDEPRQLNSDETTLQTKMTPDHEHIDHDVQPFNEAHDTRNPKVHAGIMWCNDCEVDFSPERIR